MHNVYWAHYAQNSKCMKCTKKTYPNIYRLIFTYCRRVTGNIPFLWKETRKLSCAGSSKHVCAVVFKMSYRILECLFLFADTAPPIYLSRKKETKNCFISFFFFKFKCILRLLIIWQDVQEWEMIDSCWYLHCGNVKFVLIHIRM